MFLHLHPAGRRRREKRNDAVATYEVVKEEKKKKEKRSSRYQETWSARKKRHYSATHQPCARLKRPATLNQTRFQSQSRLQKNFFSPHLLFLGTPIPVSRASAETLTGTMGRRQAGVFFGPQQVTFIHVTSAPSWHRPCGSLPIVALGVDSCRAVGLFPPTPISFPRRRRPSPEKKIFSRHGPFSSWWHRFFFWSVWV